jgi:phosphatidylglycerophosphate synthase
LFSPNAVGYPPWWAHILCSIGLFAYQSLDAIDGKQARRTNSSTPLGELFDHGCDAVSTVFVIIGLCVSLRLGLSPWFMFITVFLAMSAFYVAHWQTYVTGTLKFGKIDVTEAQLVTYTIFAISGIFGDYFWSMNIPLFGLEFRYLPIIGAMFGAVVTVLTNILHMHTKGGKGKNGSSVANSSIVFPIFPMLLFLFLSFSIANTSKGNLYESNICTYLITFGLVWVKICIKLIIAHMTKGEIFLLDTCLIGPAFLFLNQYFNYLIPEIYLLWFSLILVSGDLFKYCSKVCYQICNHMNIYLFKIKY